MKVLFGTCMVIDSGSKFGSYCACGVQWFFWSSFYPSSGFLVLEWMSPIPFLSERTILIIVVIFPDQVAWFSSQSEGLMWSCAILFYIVYYFIFICWCDVKLLKCVSLNFGLILILVCCTSNEMIILYGWQCQLSRFLIDISLCHEFLWHAWGTG